MTLDKIAEKEHILSVIRSADTVLFLSFLNETESTKNRADFIQDADSFLVILNEFLLRIKSKRDSLKLIVDTEIQKPGFISLDSIALKEHKTVIRRAKDLKKLLEQRQKTLPQRKNKITAPMVALLCYLIDKSGSIKRGSENAEEYCKKVCKEFSLDYTDRVRQNFSPSVNTEANRRKVISIILPSIPESSQNAINAYLTKMYG